MSKYKLSYYYLATGMEGIADTYPEKIIEANSKDEAIYKYHKFYDVNFGTFKEFMSKEEYVKNWGISIELLNN